MLKKIIAFVFVFVVLEAILLFYPEKTYSVFQSSDVKTLFNNYISENENNIETESLSGNSLTYYDTSYYINGLLSAAEGMKDETILIKAIHYIDNMISKASDLNADGYLEWDLIGGQPNQLDHFQGSVAIARAAAVISSIPEFKSTYQAKADKYVNFIDNAIFRYWFDKYTGIYYVGDDSFPGYTFNYYGELPWVQQKYGGAIRIPTPKIWSDKGALVGTIAAYMYQATQNLKYEDFASRIGMEFRDRLKTNNSGWIWSTDIPLDHWKTSSEGSGYYNEPTHDTSHANREPRMMIAMYEAGVKYQSNLIFTKSDIERMANTLTDIIWNGSLTEPRFSNYINGSNKNFGGSGPSVIGNIYEGWSMLGKYSQKAEEVIMSTLAGIQSGQTIGQNNSSHGKISLSGNILRNDPPPPTPPTLSLTVSPTTINYNTASTLTWIVGGSKVDYCKISGAWGPLTQAEQQYISIGTHTQTTGNLKTTSTFTMFCSGPGGTTQTQSATVSVSPNPATMPIPTPPTTSPVLPPNPSSSPTTSSPTPASPSPATNPNTTPSTPKIIPGCGNRKTGFSTVSGISCKENIPTSTRTYNLGTTTLKNGSKGEAVMELQRFLNDKLNLGLVIDGKLGPKTIAIIKKWQKDNGLVVDGLVGPKTKTLINIGN